MILIQTPVAESQEKERIYLIKNCDLIENEMEFYSSEFHKKVMCYP